MVTESLGIRFLASLNASTLLSDQTDEWKLEGFYLSPARWHRLHYTQDIDWGDGLTWATFASGDIILSILVCSQQTVDIPDHAAVL